MATLTIFANFYINDEERFLRMKDSFSSFKDIETEKWVINVRGKFKFETLSFLREHLEKKLIPFTLESKQGWFYDTKQMLDQIDSDFVLFWVEDHLNQVDTTKYQEIIDEMKSTGSDYLTYSWWFFGRSLKACQEIEKVESKNIFSFILDQKANRQINEKYSTYIISMLGIFSSNLFKKIIKKGPPILRGYPKQTPFDFEKGPEEIYWLPIHYAIPKYELFASIDDGIENYSLQARGLYPQRALRQNLSKRNLPFWKSIFRNKIKKIIPNFLYKKLIRVVIFYTKVSNYAILLMKGL